MDLLRFEGWLSMAEGDSGSWRRRWKQVVYAQAFLQTGDGQIRLELRETREPASRAAGQVVFAPAADAARRAGPAAPVCAFELRAGGALLTLTAATPARRDAWIAVLQGDEVDLNSFETAPPLMTAMHVRINWSRLLFQWLVHVFSPFSLPVYLWRKGNVAARNQKLLCTGWGNHLAGTGMVVLALLALVLYSRRKDAFEAAGFEWLEATSPFFIVIVHRLMVGLKYAYLSDEEYCMLLQCPDPDVSQQWFSETQLISGWFNVGPVTARHNLGTAMAVQRADLTDMPLQVDVSDADLNAWPLPAKSKRGALRHVTLTAHEMFMCILQRRQRDSYKPQVIFAVVCGVLQGTMGPGSRVFRGQVTGSGQSFGAFGDGSWDQALFTACTLVPATFIGTALLGFMTVAAVDYARRWRVVLDLGALLESSDDRCARNGAPMLLPLVPENAFAWINMRLVAAAWGDRYKRRSRGYVITTCCGTGAVVLILLTDIVSRTAAGAAPADLRGSFSVQSGLFLLFYFGVLLMTMLLPAMRCNALYPTQRLQLSRNLMLAHQRSHCAETGVRTPNIVPDDMLERLEAHYGAALNLLASIAEATPETFLGAAADAALLNTMGTIMGSTFLFALSQVA